MRHARSLAFSYRSFAEFVSEGGEATADMALHRSQRHGEVLTDLLVGEILEECQGEHPAAFLG